ncbi:MAG: phosphoglucosamine mutase [Nitrospirae bacterium GWC2_57_13]|nr:MAG: phosphoglucosamine mutase [Nitrospirae bacterium GWC2_57_13]
MRRLFGTDGVRGVANQDPMTSEMALRIGRAAAHAFRDSSRRHRIVIGKDTRLSGYMIESALTSGICSMGVDVLLVGPVPTPGIAFLTRSLRADAGVVISASHNPYEDNGIKFFGPDGHKLADAVEAKIEDLIFTGTIDGVRPTASELGKAYRIDDAVGRYNEFVKSSLPKGMDFTGLRVVVDSANGAAYKIGPQVLLELGADVISLYDQPDGTNINRGCGSLHPEVISRAVRANKAHAGIAYDGDADRVIFCDEAGRIIDGDTVMAVCALDMIGRGKLRHNTLVATVMSNLGLERAITDAGGKLVRTAVGDRYVMERMLADGFNLGGEQSGHVIFLDHNTTGDGIVTALQVLAIMKQKDKPLSELAACMTTYPQILVNVKVRERMDLASVPDIARRMAEIEKQLNGTGRLLVRYSGTEPKVRVMLEGENEDEIKKLAEDLAGIIREKLA